MELLDTKPDILFLPLTHASATYSKAELDSMGVLFKRNFINSLSGYKSINLIGSVNHNGLPNLAIFNSVFHVGSDPPLIGMLMVKWSNC